MAKKTDDTVVENPPVEDTASTATPSTEESPDVTAPTKRGRGRPSNASKAAAAAAGAGATPVGESGPRPTKRGRKGAPSYDQAARLALANQVKGLHELAAMGTGIPEFRLADQEAILLADAMANVSEQYGLSLSGKTGALVQMAAACAMIYAPRFAMVQQRVRATKAKTVEGNDVTLPQGAALNGDAATSAAH